MPTSEAAFLRALLIDLNSLDGVRAWRQSSGVLRTLDGQRMAQVGLPGMADISGLARIGALGVRLEIECKAEGGKLRDAQVNWKTMVESLGGLYFVEYADDSLGARGSAKASCMRIAAVLDALRPRSI